MGVPRHKTPPASERAAERSPSVKQTAKPAKSRSTAAILTDARAPILTRERFEAALFDMDGVLTSTAQVHAAAWKQMFDHYLQSRSRRTGEPFRPFDLDADYKQYVDGKPRYD
ncbi:MAG TPA: hypothetical protein VMI06_09710, partial [Terriglobia bacterium]|nr:hypothetical protein [Terriglobia bacterium]